LREASIVPAPAEALLRSLPLKEAVFFSNGQTYTGKPETFQIVPAPAEALPAKKAVLISNGQTYTGSS